MRLEFLSDPISGACGRCGKTDAPLCFNFLQGVGERRRKMTLLCAVCGERAKAYIESKGGGAHLPVSERERGHDLTSAAPTQLPASPTVPEVEPVAAVASQKAPAATGKWKPGHLPPDDKCPVHVRWLSYTEIESGACWWCHPEKAPEGHAVRKLSQDQLAALMPGERMRVRQ